MKRFYSLLMIVLASQLIAQGDPAHPTLPDERLVSGQVKSLWIESRAADIFPVPVEVNYTGEYYHLYDNNGKPIIIIYVSNSEERKAANIFNRQLTRFSYKPLPVVNDLKNIVSEIKIIIDFISDDNNLKEFGGQAYSIKWLTKKQSVVKIAASSQKGLIYGAVSLAQLVINQNGNIVMRKADVFDYPKFVRRIFNASPIPSHLINDLDWMVRYKIETIAFHNKNWSWFTLDDQLKENLKKYSEWRKQYGGVEAVLMLNLYRTKDLEVTNEEHINALKNNIKTAYQNGVTRVMLMSDDSPPFKFDEGYILTSENDKAIFPTMAEAHCWMMNKLTSWSDEKKYEIEYWYCPGFYTYEEMHYGDMELFKDTPWEDDVYGPLKRDLKIIGEQMPDEVFVFWTGPHVCSRRITNNDLNEWTNNLQGRAPFLFDNSIFSQLEFTASTMFTAYGNSFPKKFHIKTGGSGIFINGDAVSEVGRTATMTANAYMWEGEKYKPKNSLITAISKLYGSDAAQTLLNYKDIELKLTKEIKQREVWFVADSLWDAIRDTRFITDKNPFHYHQNYGRLKALRLQLKYSVPEPEAIEIFKKKCIDLNEKRLELLRKIEELSLERLSYSLQSEMIELPDFSKINNTGKL